MSDPTAPGSEPPTPPSDPSVPVPPPPPPVPPSPPSPPPSPSVPGSDPASEPGGSAPDEHATDDAGPELLDGSPEATDDLVIAADDVAFVDVWAPTLPDATVQMPATAAPVAATSAMPPQASPVETYPEAVGTGVSTPWYKRAGAVIAALIVVAAIAGGIAWLFFGGGDDDEPTASPQSSLLVLEATDETGAPLDVGFIVGVDGPAAAQFDYTWIQPPSGVLGEAVGDSTGSDGRLEFEWQPAGAESDPTTWAATVTVVQSIPAGWTAPGPLVECTLQRPDTDDTVVSMAVEVGAPDPAADQLANYTFPNYQFLAGDTVTCTLSSTRPIETTTTTPTTIEDSTTTAPPAPTTVAPVTTVPVVTVPPQPEATLWDVIINSPDLSELRALVELAGLQDVLSDPNATLTLLAPSNQAIDTAAGGVGAPDFGNPSVVESVLLTHVDDTEALLVTQLLALTPPEFVVVNPGPHAIDAAANPPTIGGARILVADIEAANGVLHVIDKVLVPQTLPN